MNDADQLLQELLGITISSKEEDTNEQLQPQSEIIQEIYQLPVKTGISGKSIEDEGDAPWIVGYFSPNAPTDINHTHHDGVDLKASRGTPIYPIASGIVTDVGVYPKSGNYIKISHENGKVVSFNAHLDSVNVQKGQKVNQETIIGKMGDTGNAKGRGAHLHFEIRINGSLINPLSIIGKQVGSLSKQAKIFNLIKIYSNIIF